MITFIGRTFADTYGDSNELGAIERKTLSNLLEQVEKKFPDDNNIFINLTFFFTDHADDNENKNWYIAKKYAEKFINGNLFLFCGADPTPHAWSMIEIYETFKNFNIYKIGNFNSKFSWHLISVILLDRFRKYTNNEILLNNLKYKFLSYSRKPHDHRVELYKKLIDNDLLQHGVATLGKHERTDVYFTLNENVEDYKDHGHWHDNFDFNIPHDIFSLGNINIWQEHFLNIVNETLPHNPNWFKNLPKQEIMVTEKTLKPIIGLRPFLINSDPEIYQWLRNRGFKTFTHWFPIDDIENPNTLHDKIIEVLVWLSKQPNEQIEQMYQNMLPDLIHNRNRFFEFAQEEKLRIDDIL